MAKKFNPVEVRKVAISKQSGLLQAEIFQLVEESYGRSANNSRTNSFFKDEDFGEELKTVTYPSKRVAWINVPEGSTVESIQALCNAAPNARCYRVLSFDPMDIMTDGQRAAWNDPSKYDFSRDEWVEKRMVRNLDGEIVLDPVFGKPMYRQSFFDKDGREDIDLRPESAQRLGLTPADQPVTIDAEAFDQMSAQGNPFGNEA